MMWDMLCLALDKGGLRRGKWLWRYEEEEGELWRRAIVEKHIDGASKWSPNATRGAYGVSIWKSIV